MRTSIIAVLLLGLPFAVNAENTKHTEIQQYTAEAKSITSAFFNELKSALGSGLKAGGPEAATQVCYSLAPQIAKKHSQSSGWDIARTSLKLRNPENAPDAWETEVLKRFAEQVAHGESPDKLVYTEIVDTGDERYFRFMKGIVMPPAEKMPCLQCHGENMQPETVAAIDKLYPQDAARGYKAGQVRGAFTLQKQL